MSEQLALHAPEPLEQFERPTNLVHGAVRVAGTKVPVKYTAEFPEIPHYRTIAMIVPGFGAIKRSSRALRHQLASVHGIPTISYDPARTIDAAKNRVSQLLDPQDLHARSIAAIMQDVDQLTEGSYLDDYGKTVIAHSMGGLAATRYVFENPQAVDTLIHISTVGAEGPLGLRLAPRALRELGTDVLPAIASGEFGYHPGLGLKAIQYFTRNPMRTASEIVSCMRSDTRPATEEIRNQGVYLGYIALQDDAFFKIGDARQEIKHYFDEYHELPFKHIAPQTKAPVVADAVAQVLAPHAYTQVSATYYSS